MSLARGTRFGPYEVLAPLGAGAMGEVYRACDTRLARIVAIKVLTSGAPNRLARVEREARAISRVSHPHICALYDFGQQDGIPFLVMEYLEGETLARQLEAAPLALSRALDLSIQVAEALDAAHRRGVTHRDLKPGNIMLTRDGVKLLDFGLAKLRDVERDPNAPESTRSLSLTEEGAVLGTYPYMAPEQVNGLEADARTDIFSLGVVLYEMLSGDRPFQAGTRAGLAAAILTRDPPPVSTLCAAAPPVLDRVVARCLTKDPDARWQTARDLASELRWVAEGGVDARAAPERLTKGTWRYARTRIAWTAIGVSVGALAVLMLNAGGYLGGAPATVPRFIQVSFQRGTLTSARFAPDGQTIVYSAAWHGQPYELYLTRQDSSESRALGFREARILSISRTGQMAFITGGQMLWGGQGTLARASLSGGALRELLDDVREADWIAGGPDLAVVRHMNGVDVLEFPIGSKVLEAPNMGSMRVSPDGSEVAVFAAASDSRGDGVDVVVVNRSGRKIVLSANWLVGYGLAWSPNGAEVWFTGSQGGLAPALHAVSLSGAERPLVRAPGLLHLQDVFADGRVLLSMVNEGDGLSCLPPGATEERDLSWFDGPWVQSISADGRFVLFGEQRAGGFSEVRPHGQPRGLVYRRATDGSPAVRLGEGRAEGLSPDGQWALAESTEKSAWVLLPVGAGSPRTLPRGSFVGLGGGDWLPDSQRIVFTAFETSGHRRVYVQDIEGGPPRPITPDGYSLTMNGETPDGRFVIAGSDDGFFLFPIESGPPRRLNNLGGTPIQWTPDGRSLFVRRGRVPAEIDRLEVGTGRRQLWKTLIPRDPVGVERIFPVVITPDGGSYCYTYTRNLVDLFVVEDVT